MSDTHVGGATISEGTTLLTNLPARRAAGQSRPLDGSWRAIIDPYDSGYIDILGNRNTRGYYRDFGPRHPGDRVEYNFDTSLELHVPGDWNTQHPELLYYEGTIWYRRVIDIEAGDPEAAESGRTFLSIGAANHTTRVFLDGEELAVHVGGFGPFSVEVTGRLGTGRHSLVLMVDNRRQPQRIPAMRSDWWNFGGVHRSVELISVPETFLRDAWTTMTSDGRIVGGVTVDGPDTAAAVIVDIPGIGPTRLDGADTFEIDARRAADVARWAPGAPVLHDVRFAIDPTDGRSADEVVDQVGFRTVRVEGTKILVNDVPTFLRGISMHAEGPSGGRRASGPDDAATLFDWVVDLGANFVRLAHYQHDEAMVREADRRGLLAWCELPVYWGIDFANADTLANGRDQADELVMRDRSRASVILWSVANETLPGPDRHAFLGSLIERTRELDSTRLVTAALLTLPSADPSVHIDDPLGELVDVIGVNQYLGWYYGNRADIADTVWTSDFGKPMVFSELGAGAKAGLHGSPDEIWTEEFQAAVYDAQLTMIGKQAECAGVSPWILKDFRTPLRVLPGVQDGYNRKGVVSEEGERKLAFEVLADWYRSRR